MSSVSSILPLPPLITVVAFEHIRFFETTTDKMLTTICLAGGCMGGFAHIGFLQCLSDRKLLDYVDTWVGCSIGSLISLMSVIGMSPAEIMNKCLPLNGSIFNLKNMSKVWAGYDGEYFFAFMVDILVSKGFDPGITFLELQMITGKRLIVCATNLTTAQEFYLSPTGTPDEKVLRAIRMSVAIPFLLTPVVLENNDCMVDGGVSENYPMEYAMHDYLSRHPLLDPFSAVMGCNLEGHPPKSIHTLEEFAAALIFCLLRKPSPAARFIANTVRIYLNFEDTFDFSADVSVREKLHKIGCEETMHFLAKHPRWNMIRNRTGTKCKVKID
jgi:predicted acylesterase/phospholipase RssA